MSAFKAYTLIGGQKHGKIATFSVAHRKFEYPLADGGDVYRRVIIDGEAVMLADGTSKKQASKLFRDLRKTLKAEARAERDEVDPRSRER